MKSSVRGQLLLLVTALIWGAAFVAQSVGMEYVGPFTFNGARFLLASVALLPVIALMQRRGEAKQAVTDKAPPRTLWLGGLICGVFLAVASMLQQYGLITTSAGKAGFITALYIVIVPLLGLPFGKRLSRGIWMGIVLATIGLYLLCMQGGMRLENGDLAVLLCAFAFSFQIWAIDYYGQRVDGVKLSCLQFLVAGTLCTIGMFVFESPSISQLLACWLPLLYTGILSSSVGYTFQILGQRETKPAVACLIMSLEAVFAAMFGWLILGEALSARELMGAGLMFAAILLAQAPSRASVGRVPSGTALDERHGQ